MPTSTTHTAKPDKPGKDDDDDLDEGEDTTTTDEDEGDPVLATSVPEGTPPHPDWYDPEAKTSFNGGDTPPAGAVASSEPLVGRTTRTCAGAS